MGSTLHHVVREASCPVLTVRPVGGLSGAPIKAQSTLAWSRS
jgi:hypothetical protein